TRGRRVVESNRAVVDRLLLVVPRPRQETQCHEAGTKDHAQGEHDRTDHEKPTASARGRGRRRVDLFTLGGLLVGGLLATYRRWAAPCLLHRPTASQSRPVLARRSPVRPPAPHRPGLPPVSSTR